MRPNEIARNTASSGSLGTSYFDVDTSSLAHLFRVLRDSLYSNKILAVLREYGANAWDEHREAGCPGRSIKVVLPTKLDSSVQIRDFGRGLSHQMVLRLLTMYGASSKRDTDLSVGKYGIGAKSGFAYNDSFTVTSYHGGLKMVFHAYLDETDLGVASKMFEAASGPHLRAFLHDVLGIDSEIGEGWVDSRQVLEHPLFVELSEGWDLCLSSSEDSCEGELVDHFRKEGLISRGQETSEEHIRFLVRREILLAYLSKFSDEFETGLQVKIPVLPQDLDKFRHEASTLFRYFEPKPDINIDLEPVPHTWKNESGWLHKQSNPYGDRWVAVMGCIPYRLDMSQVSAELADIELSDFIRNLQGGLIFDIGEVDIVASRESLEYKPRTKKAIVEKVRLLVREVTRELDEVVADKTISSWNRRLKIQEFVRRTSIPCRDDIWKSVPQVTIYKDRVSQGGILVAVDGSKEPLNPPTHFTLKKVAIGRFDKDGNPQQGSGRTRMTLQEDPTISIVPESRILVKDDPRNFRGFIRINDFSYDTILVLKEGSKVSEAMSELDQMLKGRRLDGIPVQKMSEMEYRSLRAQKSEVAESNPKYSNRAFVLADTFSGGAKAPSDNWIHVDREPEDDDVFVVIERFRVVDGAATSDFFEELIKDRGILKNVLGLDMPPIYAYKTLKNDRIQPDSLSGTMYSEWFMGFLKEALALRTEFRELLEAHEWSNLYIGSQVDRWVNYGGWENRALKLLEDNFESYHPLINIFRKRVEANQVKSNFRKQYGERTLEAFRELTSSDRYKDALPVVSSPGEELEKVILRYPLLSPRLREMHGLGHLQGPDQMEHWIQYIKLMDEQLSLAIPPLASHDSTLTETV